MAVTAATGILALVVITALAFDFTNGFHDTGNAMATSIATGALQAPRSQWPCRPSSTSSGAFLSRPGRLTVTNAVINIQDRTGAPRADLVADGGEALLLIVLAGLVGRDHLEPAHLALGLPSSSSHALFGGLIGATIAGLGASGVKWVGDGTKLDGVVGKVILRGRSRPSSPSWSPPSGPGSSTGSPGRSPSGSRDRGFRWGQIGSASLVSLAHGTNDAQKTMGVITLALIAAGHWSDTGGVPLWVKVACASAIALGTYIGGWRIIRTLGKGLVEIEPRPRGWPPRPRRRRRSSPRATSGSPCRRPTSRRARSSARRGARARRSAGGCLRMVIAWLITLPIAASSVR